MLMPTEERVSQLVAGLVAHRGSDLRGVEIATAGRRADAQARVKVTMDSDDMSNLDTLAALSSEVSELLDARELELAGGVVSGRPQPGQETADTRGTTDAVSVTASDSPTEGIVE